MPEVSLESKQKQASPWTAGVAHEASQQVATWAEPTGDSRALGPRHSPLISLQRAMGNQAVGRMLQTKLTVSEPGDIYEQEADRSADQVMRMPDPAPPFPSSSTDMLRRKCESCSEEDEKKKEEESHEKLSRKALSEHSGQSRALSPILHLQRTIGNQAAQRMLQTPTEGLNCRIDRYGITWLRARCHSDFDKSSSRRSATKEIGDQ